jgi:hypothetical protein
MVISRQYGKGSQPRGTCRRVERWLGCGSADASTQQQISGSVHRLHRLVATAAIGMVFGGGALPGPGYIRLGDPTRKGQVQSLSGHDGVQVRMLA